MTDEVAPVGVRVASSGLSTNFLQSLDLLFAKLDESQGYEDSGTSRRSQGNEHW